MEGIPRAVRLSARDCRSSAPVRNPGMMTAALMLGSGLLGLMDDDDDDESDDDDDDDDAARDVTCSIDFVTSKKRSMIEFPNIAIG